MKASTLFALTVALVLGLGAAAAARYAGLFEKKVAEPPPVAAKPLPKVLVAKANLYEEVGVTADMVAVRDLQPEELAFYETNRDKFLPASPMAAHLLVPTRQIAVGQPLMKDYFKDGLPETISTRLEAGARAVNVVLEKDRAAGGVIRVGEFVDVLLTTRVGGGDPAQNGIRTACIARECKVVMKRNNLWTVLAANPDHQPVHYTLQANPYRATLIDYAQRVGQVTMVPVPAPARKAGLFTDPSSKEYADEDMRVEAVNRGELVVGPADLQRILNLKPAAAPPPPVVVRHVSGAERTGVTVFPPAPGAPAAAGAENRPFTFDPPPAEPKKESHLASNAPAKAPPAAAPKARR